MTRSGRALARRLLACPLGALLALAACSYPPVDRKTDAELLAGGDAERGREMIRAYGCGACHTIGGVTGANAKVGPALDGLGERAYIAGVVPNEPYNLVAWIVNPKAIDPKTAMPALGVRQRDARDIASYIYTLH